MPELAWRREVVTALLHGLAGVLDDERRLRPAESDAIEAPQGLYVRIRHVTSKMPLRARLRAARGNSGSRVARIARVAQAGPDGPLRGNVWEARRALVIEPV